MVETLKTASYPLIFIKKYSKKITMIIVVLCGKGNKIHFSLRKLNRSAELSKIQNDELQKPFSNTLNLKVSLLSHSREHQAEKKNQVIYFREMLICKGIKRAQPNTAASHKRALRVYQDFKLGATYAGDIIPPILC